MAELGTRQSTPHPVAWLLKDWESVLAEVGEKRFRARQVFRWIHQRGVFDPELMTDLAKPLRGLLKDRGLGAPLVVDDCRRSADGTRKLLLRLDDGRRVECVLIPMTDEASADADLAAVDELDDAEDNDGLTQNQAPDAPSKRATLCISTQVGCAMGCVFCASGKAGLTRGLNAAEIVGQVLLAKDYLDPDERLRNIVFMGMGEPLHHYEQTRRAIQLITTPDGLAMSPRRITVSTVGLVPGIARLGADFEGKLGLAISLHAPDDETRNKIIPMNAKWGVAALRQALLAYPLPKRRRITIEYTLMAGVNDGREHALRLIETLRGLRVKVNLIPMNPIEGSELRAPDETALRIFRETLAGARVSCSVRKRRGDDVDAACGQLALRKDQLLDPAGLRRPQPLDK